MAVVCETAHDGQATLRTTVACPYCQPESATPTDCSVCEHDKQTGVVNPLDLEPSTDGLPVDEGSLDVTGLEFLREPSQGQDACDACRELGEGSRHDLFVQLSGNWGCGLER